MMEQIGARADRFTILIDRTTGIVTVTLTGFWSVDDLDAYHPAIARALALSRATRGHARVLFDLRQAALLSAEMFDVYKARDSSFTRRDDLIAIVLGSGILKMQTRRLDTSRGTNRYFDTPDDAAAWLTASGPEKHAGVA